MENKKGYTEEYREKWRERNETNSARKNGGKVKEKA